MSEAATPEARRETMPLIFALIERGDPALVRAHLSAHPHAATAEDASGAMPLHVAARGGHAELAELLLQAGAPIEARDRFHDSTPLAWAAYYGNVRLVQVLVLAGADPSVQNRYQLTPIEIAEGGARGEHAADCPDRSAEDFHTIIRILAALR